ncbi:hypothetical protein GXP67_05470 [Rhodocytophaga rosea]|uniref:Lipoprotein n=1 Tax=Rhodocytophaga rosea TaxID=2704465 RepID=A0A6C0GDW4_9BACT|nr:hypothetical protein [Rhodocytophaga rosea]QHT66155.1 hypothetical protein GXP67_05470 [Rhodocytophaga rosea]
MNKILHLLLVVWLVSSCQEKQAVVEYLGTKQKLNVNDKDVKLITHLPDSIIVGRQTLFKLTTSSKEHKLVQAYFDCQVDTSSYIDTISYRIADCNKRLALINDTIVVALKPQKSGDFVFPETIVAISRGKDGVFRYHTGTFKYKVAEKQ